MWACPDWWANLIIMDQKAQWICISNLTKVPSAEVKIHRSPTQRHKNQISYLSIYCLRPPVSTSSGAPKWEESFVSTYFLHTRSKLRNIELLTTQVQQKPNHYLPHGLCAGKNRRLTIYKLRNENPRKQVTENDCFSEDVMRKINPTTLILWVLPRKNFQWNPIATQKRK